MQHRLIEKFDRSFKFKLFYIRSFYYRTNSSFGWVGLKKSFKNIHNLYENKKPKLEFMLYIANIENLEKLNVQYQLVMKCNNIICYLISQFEIIKIHSVQRNTCKL